MKSGSVGCGGAKGMGRRPNGSGRASSWNVSPGRSRRTRAMATTDFSVRAITSTSVFSIADGGIEAGGRFLGAERAGSDYAESQRLQRG